MTAAPSRTVPVVALLIAVLAVLLPATAHATVDSGAEAAFLTSIDRERAGRGLPALRRASDLQAVARRHAVRMADRGTLYHNPDLGSEVSGWSKLGENVGRGPDAGAVHHSFMTSPSHRDNILSAAFVEVGVGVERRGDVIWVTQVFRTPSGSRPAPGTTPTAEPTPAPAPAPEPTTSTAPAAAPPPAASPSPAPRSNDTTDTPSTPSEAGVGTASASGIRPAPAPAVVDRLTVTLAGIEADDTGLSVAELLDLP